MELVYLANCVSVDGPDQVQDMLCGGGRMLDARRVSTAAKAVGLSAMHADSGGAMGLLAALGQMLTRQPRLATMLEHEPGTPSGALLFCIARFRVPESVSRWDCWRGWRPCWSEYTQMHTNVCVGQLLAQHCRESTGSRSVIS